MSKRFSWLSLGSLAVICSLSLACSRISPWEKENTAGSKAAAQGNTVEAERQFTAALHEAGKSGEPDLRLATSLSNLAAVYQDNGEYALAEQLYRRALAIEQEILLPGDPVLTDTLSNLAAVQLAAGKSPEVQTDSGQTLEGTAYKTESGKE